MKLKPRPLPISFWQSLVLLVAVLAPLELRGQSTEAAPLSPTSQPASAAPTTAPALPKPLGEVVDSAPNADMQSQPASAPARERQPQADSAGVTGARQPATLTPARSADLPPSAKARFNLSSGPTSAAPRRDPLVRRGIFDRPYLARIGSASTNLALGGYIDLLGSYRREAGISEGFGFEARRFNLFVGSQIADFIRMTAEIEFEHGTEEIALETALLDLLLHHAFNLRGGILLVPLGKFNVAHDSPLYDVVDRPLVSTRIIPSTLSEVGFGFFGVFYPGMHRLTYQLYLLNGLTSGVLAAEGTRLAEGKLGSQFESDENGVPALSARIGYSLPARAPVSFEVAASAYAGIYNKFKVDGEALEARRWLTIVALDAEVEYARFLLRGEFAYAHVDLPPSLTELHASDQWGLYLEALVRASTFRLFVFERAQLFGVARIDHVDLNANRRPVTGDAMGDETTRLTFGVSLRPASGTALRLIYYQEWLRDPLRNRARAGAVQLGLASYF